MNWEPVYGLLLLFCTTITYAFALWMEKWRDKRKLFMILGVSLNLLSLIIFKYYNFLTDNIVSLLSLCGLRVSFPKSYLLLPVGISFYVFQSLGYLIDVYRKTISVEKDFITYALFVSFFPQLVAGPIERSASLLPQFKEKHVFEPERAISGINLILWGYFLKLVLADRCAIYVDSVFNNLMYHNGGSTLLASFLFCFQLYGDFAGYSFIAIGCARIMGIDIMDNFNRPYFFSYSVQDFWKRNHISLTTWFMDYIYYPLVGSSVNIWWWCFCIFITFFISGFWHGANWTYVICFSIFGFYLVICLLKDRRQKRFEKKYGLKKKQWWLWLNRATTFILVSLALVFFRANNVHDGFLAISKIFTDISLTMINEKKQVLFAGIMVLITFVVEYLEEYKIFQIKNTDNLANCSLFAIVILVMILAFGIFDGGQFIYFQF